MQASQQPPKPPLFPALPRLPDAMRNLLVRQELKQRDRRFDETATLTGFGALA